MMPFKIIGELCAIETIAEGSGIRELVSLRLRYGNGNWKTRKGIALVRREDGSVATAELHWYEAHGSGKVKIEVRRWI